MPKLERSNSSKFLDRFCGFCDSVVRKVEVSYLEKGKRTVVVWVATRDLETTDKKGWVCVRLEIEGALDFCIADRANQTQQVISHGIHIIWEQGLAGVDFGHFADPPDDTSEIKSSKFFATGTSLKWSVEPY